MIRHVVRKAVACACAAVSALLVWSDGLAPPVAGQSSDATLRYDCRYRDPMSREEYSSIRARLEPLFTKRSDHDEYWRELRGLSLVDPGSRIFVSESGRMVQEDQDETSFEARMADFVRNAERDVTGEAFYVAARVYQRRFAAVSRRGRAEEAAKVLHRAQELCRHAIHASWYPERQYLLCYLAKADKAHPEVVAQDCENAPRAKDLEKIAECERRDTATSWMRPAPREGQQGEGSSTGSEEMTLVPEGDFWMGSDDAKARASEKSKHSVFVNAFWVDIREVTNAEYKRCVQAGYCTSQHYDDNSCSVYVGRSDWKIARVPDTYRGMDQPVVCVDWYQARAYCAWDEKRLPTEAEWEKAARGPDGREYPWGDDEPGCGLTVMSLSPHGEAGCGRGATWPGGAMALDVSPYGANDMAGNVSEWVGDWSSDGYDAPSAGERPLGATARNGRMVRGGSFVKGKAEMAVTFRNPDTSAEFKMSHLGFRCARDGGEGDSQSPCPSP